MQLFGLIVGAEAEFNYLDLLYEAKPSSINVVIATYTGVRLVHYVTFQ